MANEGAAVSHQAGCLPVTEWFWYDNSQRETDIFRRYR